MSAACDLISQEILKNWNTGHPVKKCNSNFIIINHAFKKEHMRWNVNFWSYICQLILTLYPFHASNLVDRLSDHLGLTIINCIRKSFNFKNNLQILLKKKFKMQHNCTADWTVCLLNYFSLWRKRNKGQQMQAYIYPYVS